MKYILLIMMFYGDADIRWMTKNFKNKHDCESAKVLLSESLEKPESELIKQGVGIRKYCLPSIQNWDK